jgi:hypothetical protein
MAQVIQHLPIKGRVLSSYSSTAKKKKKDNLKSEKLVFLSPAPFGEGPQVFY